MSKGTRKGKRNGRAKGPMGMSKHYHSGTPPRNRSVLLAVAAFWNNRRKFKPLQTMYSSMEELMKNRRNPFG